MNPAMNIDPQAVEKREMQMRAANVNFAGQLIVSMMQGVGPVDPAIDTPEQVFAFALGVAEQIQIYLNRQFDDPTRLVS